MIKDKLLRFFFIPFLGIVIPFMANIISYNRYSLPELMAGQLYFIFLSFSIWSISSWLHHKIRNWFTIDTNTFIKILTVTLTNALFGTAISGVLALIWFRISKEHFAWTPYLLTVILSVLAVVIFTLVYEVLFLSKERELDTKKVNRLDREKSRAVLSNLKNELEPHFMFNSLNTLSYLILNDPETAHVFNSKLAAVYKYFLINKEKDAISLSEEIEFIENYFFLAQLRYGNQLQLHTHIDTPEDTSLMILPFAMQVTLENAIKHNEFSEQMPLHVTFELHDDHLLVKNNTRPRKYAEASTGIGLKNLQSRYQLICKKEITIQHSGDEFIVKMPLITKTFTP